MSPKTTAVKEEDDMCDTVEQGIFQQMHYSRSELQQHHGSRLEAGDDDTEAPPIPRHDLPVHSKPITQHNGEDKVVAATHVVSKMSAPRLAPAMESETPYHRSKKTHDARPMLPPPLAQRRHLFAPRGQARHYDATTRATTTTANDVESGEMVVPPPPPPPLRRSRLLPGAVPIAGPAGVRLFGRRRPPDSQEDQRTVMTPVAAQVVRDTPLVVAVPAPPGTPNNWWSKRCNQLIVAGVLTLVIALTVVVTVLIMSGPPPAPSPPAWQWKQMGQDMDGEAAGDWSGWSVSLSAEGTTVAVGAPMKNNGNGYRSGHVRIHQWDGGRWVQLGNDLDGETARDQSGRSVSLSADGTTVVIGAPYNDGNAEIAKDAGHVRVYQWDGGGWVKLGNDLDGEEADDGSGRSVSLSADGTTVAIGAIRNGDNGDKSGHVRVYQWNGGGWGQLGNDMDGESADDRSGWSVSLSADGTTVAIGAPYNNNNNGVDAGHVRVYQFDGDDWIKVGGDLDGEEPEDYSGSAVSLSADGTTLAVGADYNDGNGSSAGHVRVSRLDGNDWIQVGSDLDGEAVDDNFGKSVSLSADGNTLAVGAVRNNGTGTDAGHVRVYRLTGNEWIQVGSNLDGEEAGDNFGRSVSLSADGLTVAVGAPLNDGTGDDSGHVRVYHLEGQ